LLILDGLQTTLFISIMSVLLGTMLGALLCSMRMSKRRSLEFAARIYISLVRGTPVLVLLMIIFYVAFARVNINPVLVAVIAFALNFAAYVAEMFRTSIESVDKGQTEAGIAGGFNRGQTFVYIVMPQAVQRLLPVYKGEVISLVKMTSVVGYIAVQDLTKAGDIIRSRTFDAFFPLLMTAMLYFALSYLLITLLNTVEKKSDPQLRKNPHHSTQAKYLLVLSILAAGAALIYTCWPSSAPVDLPRSGPITRLSQLDGKRICVITGTPGDFAVHARYKKAQILDMVYTADAALAVRTGKADAFAFDINTLQYLAANSDGQFVILPGLIAQAEIAIPMRPDDRELHQKVNAGIEQLKNDGTLDEMYRLWFTRESGP
jgi:His/Glu/Gln/Arg/opine family amino acid ABC transporter permease subunit